MHLFLALKIAIDQIDMYDIKFYFCVKFCVKNYNQKLIGSMSFALKIVKISVILHFGFSKFFVFPDLKDYQKNGNF